MDPIVTLLGLTALVLAIVAMARSGSGGKLAKRLNDFEQRWLKENRKLRDQIAQLQHLADRDRAAPSAADEGIAATVPHAGAAPITKPRASLQSPEPKHDVLIAPDLAAPVAPSPPGASDEQLYPQMPVAPSPHIAQPMGSFVPGTTEPAVAASPEIPIAPLQSAAFRSGPPPRDTLAIDWERWLGVRGAAVLGGAVLALAALLFFKYSIEHGLISPTLRVILGVLVGLGCIVGSEAIRKNYASTSNALAGAGPAVLYASFWAARSLYHLIGTTPAFALMALTTVVCSILAIRYNSLLIALLGLIGGYATPFILATGSDNPIGLFGYVLLLDIGFLAIAIRRRWVLVASLALVGTVLLEIAWIGQRMGPRLWLGLGILAIFALVFGFGIKPSAEVEENDRGTWLWTQCAGILLPFTIGLYLAARADLGPHLYPLGLLLLMLVTAAGWIAMRNKSQIVAMGAAGGATSVVVVWLATHRQTPSTAWETSVTCVALALALHFFVERNPEDAKSDGPAVPALMVNFPLFIALIAASLMGTMIQPWPWIFGWAGLAALLIRHGSFPNRSWLNWAAGIGMGAGLGLLFDVRLHEKEFLGLPLYLGVELAVAIVFQVVALLRDRASSARTVSEQASAIISLAFILQFVPVAEQSILSAPWLHIATMLFALLVTLPSTRIRDGKWYCAAVLSTAAAHTVWSIGHRDDVGLAFAMQAASVLIFTAWPFLSRAFQSDRWAWYGSALAGPVWFLSLKRLFELNFGTSMIGVLPVLLGVLTLLALVRAETLWPEGDAIRRTAFVWYSVVASGFITVAIPLQLENEWVTIGWALEGFAVMVLWKRLDHSGLKYLSWLLFAAVTVRLVFNPWLLEYYPRSALRLFNWLLYTYWAPVAALLGAAVLLKPDEVSRARAWESVVYSGKRPVGAGGLALSAILAFFVWINLAISNWFSTGQRLTISFERLPARDLTTSISWAVFAVTLLAIGMKLGSSALRWVSLAFLILTIGKVFLYDLGELKDLYRVVSLLGLAISLIIVSLAYQRFVFKRDILAKGET